MLGHILCQGETDIPNFTIINYKIQFVRSQVKFKPRNFFFKRVAVKHDDLATLFNRNFDIQPVCLVNTDDKIRQVTDRRAFRIWY